jgi:hypothetical protein
MLPDGAAAILASVTGAPDAMSFLCAVDGLTPQGLETLRGELEQMGIGGSAHAPAMQ